MGRALAGPACRLPSALGAGRAHGETRGVEGAPTRAPGKAPERPSKAVLQEVQELATQEGVHLPGQPAQRAVAAAAGAPAGAPSVRVMVE